MKGENMWKCGSCGYVHDGDEAPDKCPKCGAPKEKFEKLDDSAAELVNRSRLTNSLHMALSTLLGDVVGLAEEGIEDNLDPACVKIFTKARDTGMILINSINAELASHMKKGKWG
jgi:rubredoxin